jgi:hypothetical protein
MTITQTVDIPASRRITVPLEVPTGPVVLTFTPLTEADKVDLVDASTEEIMAAGDGILNKHLAAFKALAK